MPKRISLKRKRPTYELLTELLPLMRAASELSTVSISPHEQALLRQLVGRIDHFDQRARLEGTRADVEFASFVVVESNWLKDKIGEAPAVAHDREDVIG